MGKVHQAGSLHRIPMNTPVIVITAGEPASIAPDICIKTAQQSWNAKLVFLTSKILLKERAKLLNICITIKEINAIEECPVHTKNTLVILNQEMPSPCIAGTLNKNNSSFVIQSIQLATQLCLDNKADAMVTPPVHKGIINDSGLSFTGHTEFIAEQCNATPVMMLASKTMRVALATTHLPLKDVAAQITKDHLINTINIINHDLIKHFKIPKPHILVCGLNPHAGEDGHLGMEEIEIIEPAILKLREQGVDATGPLPADTLFNIERLKTADAVLAMYHDQGLPVLKYSSFGEGINITLGLPIIRISVDHGTALNLAGTQKSNIGSMGEALALAIELNKP